MSLMGGDVSEEGQRREAGDSITGSGTSIIRDRPRGGEMNRKRREAKPSCLLLKRARVAKARRSKGKTGRK